MSETWLSSAKLKGTESRMNRLIRSHYKCCSQPEQRCHMWLCRPYTVRLQWVLFTWTTTGAASPGGAQGSRPTLQADRCMSQNSTLSCFLAKSYFQGNKTPSPARKIWVEWKQKRNWHNMDKTISLSFQDAAAALPYTWCKFQSWVCLGASRVSFKVGEEWW